MTETTPHFKILIFKSENVTVSLLLLKIFKYNRYTKIELIINFRFFEFYNTVFMGNAQKKKKKKKRIDFFKNSQIFHVLFFAFYLSVFYIFYLK